MSETDESETVVKQPRDSKQPLLDRCHGCGRQNDGDGIYVRVERECDESSLYHKCVHCGVGVRTDRYDPSEVNNEGN